MSEKITWTPAIAVGVPLIDEQHQELFRRVNRFYAAVGEGKGKTETIQVMGFLKIYVDRHFYDEENLQRSNGYPHVEDHVAEHQHFQKRFLALQNQFFREGATVAMLEEIEGLVVHWLTEHIGRADVAVGKWLAENGQTAQAAG